MRMDNEMTCASPDPGQGYPFCRNGPSGVWRDGWMVAQGQRDPGMGAGPSPMASESDASQPNSGGL